MLITKGGISLKLIFPSQERMWKKSSLKKSCYAVLTMQLWHEIIECIQMKWLDKWRNLRKKIFTFIAGVMQPLLSMPKIWAYSTLATKSWATCTTTTPSASSSLASATTQVSKTNHMDFRFMKKGKKDGITFSWVSWHMFAYLKSHDFAPRSTKILAISSPS